jgi:uncharacterized protein (TIGR02300 family)
VANLDKGKKHTCPSCGAVFYDLKRTPIICPKCETKIEVQKLLKPRRPSPQAAKPAPKPVPVAKAEEADDDVDVEEVEDDEDDDLIEDMSDMGDDDDDMSEVKEHIAPTGDEKE